MTEALKAFQNPIQHSDPAVQTLMRGLTLAIDLPQGSSAGANSGFCLHFPFIATFTERPGWLQLRLHWGSIRTQG